MTMVHATAQLGRNVRLGQNVIIEAGAEIGDGCLIDHNVVIYQGTRLGADCDIRAAAVLGRRPRSSPSSRRMACTDLPPLELGDECIIGCNAVIYAGNRIGSQVMVGDLAAIRESNEIGNRVIIGRAVTVEYEARIHDGAVIQTGCHITDNAVIEEGVFFGVQVATCSDNSMGLAPRFDGPRIGRYARIGSNSTILPGVTIGESAFVSAGTLVARAVGAGRLIVGAAGREVMQVNQSSKTNGTSTVK
ncbi:MAG: DapH/DapD/GlmU-related protein [Candidatus Binataceae bacterium]|jgi:UDP-3-O-[3-hydroxymyristoyl] glucosamine N-acyltransferase